MEQKPNCTQATFKKENTRSKSLETTYLILYRNVYYIVHVGVKKSATPFLLPASAEYVH